MGFWAEIKHALNSTIGTANFKPLDKFIADKFTENLGVAASDTPLKILISSSTRLWDEDTKGYGSFVANTNGTIRIEATFFDDDNYENTSEFWVVDNNGTRIGKMSTDEYMGTPQKYSLDINVKKDTTYTVYMTAYRSSGYCNSLKVCGSSVHSTLIS